MTPEIENEAEPAESQGMIRSYPRRWLIGSVVGILVVGAIFYHFVEGWGWLDSFYFCAITLATIGYGDLAPKTDLGKLFTIFYAFAGLGVVAAYIEIAGREGLQRRYERFNRDANLNVQLRTPIHLIATKRRIVAHDPEFALADT